MTGVLSKTEVAAKMQVNRAEPEPPKMGIELLNPVDDLIPGYARENLERHGPHTMVGPNMFTGQVLALCGAGPSLADERIQYADQIWACNSAVPYLWERGVELTGAVGIDQTDEMLNDWADPPPIRHYIASTVSPRLVEHLKAHDVELVWFHNYIGWDQHEDPAQDSERCHYNEEWPPAFMVSSGATVVPRVINMAWWMGFARIDVYGADCCLRMDGTAHANGETYEDAWTSRTTLMEGKVGGRQWRARPDMLMAAVDLVRRVRESQGRVRLIGDTLPAALLGADDEMLAQVMRRLDHGEVPA